MQLAADMARWQASWKQRDVDTLICGGIGGGARTALAEIGLRFIRELPEMRMPMLRHFLQGSLFMIRIPCAVIIMKADIIAGEHSCGEDKHGCGRKSLISERNKEGFAGSRIEAARFSYFMNNYLSLRATGQAFIHGYLTAATIFFTVCAVNAQTCLNRYGIASETAEEGKNSVEKPRLLLPLGVRMKALWNFTSWKRQQPGT